MKQQHVSLSTILLALSAALSLAVGASLPAICEFSARAVGRQFAVSYRIEPRVDLPELSGLSSAVPAYLAGDTVVISASSSSPRTVSVPLDSVILSAEDPAALRANTVRSGLLSLLLFVVAMVIPALLAVTGVSCARHSSAASCARRRPRRPLPPYGPQRLPQAA